MLTLLAVFHVLIALGLILFVLLQDPKGGAAGMFGGGGASSNTLFGATGAGNFLTATTKWLAGLFAVSCLGLAYMTSHKSESVMDAINIATPPAGATATPAATSGPELPSSDKDTSGSTPPAAPGTEAPDTGLTAPVKKEDSSNKTQ